MIEAAGYVDVTAVAAPVRPPRAHPRAPRGMMRACTTIRDTHRRPAPPGQRLSGHAGHPRRRHAGHRRPAARRPARQRALAQETATHAPSLHRVLRALASVGVLHEDDDGRFALTAIGECLRSDAAEPVGAWAAFVGRPYHWQAWGALLHGVRTGESPFRSVHGTDVWDYRAAHPEEGAIFDAAMTDIMRRANAHLLAAYDFGRFATVVDVGGGRGAFLGAILEAHPGDARHPLRPAPRRRGRGRRRALRGRRAAASSTRCPEGADAYVLKAVLHDWEDDDALRDPGALPCGDPRPRRAARRRARPRRRPTRTPTPSSPTST